MCVCVRARVCKLKVFLFIFLRCGFSVAEERQLSEIQSLTGRAFVKKCPSDVFIFTSTVIFVVVVLVFVVAG